MQSQIMIFSKRVADYLRPAPAVLSAETEIAEVVGRMAASQASSALIVDGEGRLTGIVTEQDVTRRAAFSCTGTEPASSVMTRPVQSVAASDYLYRAIASMRRFGWRHMPVVDDEGRPCGMLDLHDALAIAGEQTLRHVGRIAHDGGLEGLREIKAAEVDLAEDLFADSVPASDVQALLTDINRDIHRRVLAAALKDMAAAGHGPPPVDFAAIIMGSGGRGESFLFPDQDNGFILADYADDKHDEINEWFIAMAERLTRDLDAVGLPLCKGHVMATNPLWRKSLSQWIEQIDIWSRKRNSTTLRLCDIFFDFRAVWGETAMAKTLRDHVTDVTVGNAAFLREMYDDDRDHSVALGWFGRFITESNIEEHKGEINLKITGTLPLVEAIRLLSLREGVTRLSTLGRIEALFEKGVLGPDEHDYLAGAYRHISRLLLRRQIADFQAGKTVSNYVDPDELSQREKDILTDSFKAIRDLRDRMKGEMTGDIF